MVVTSSTRIIIQQDAQLWPGQNRYIYAPAPTRASVDSITTWRSKIHGSGARVSDDPKRVYWDTSVFICFLNRTELNRRSICEDILYEARDGVSELYTSTWTIAEVVRPKITPQSVPLTPEQVGKIKGMFEWKWLRKIQVDQRIATYAAELARDHNLKPADAVHAASAILKPCDVLQKWDRDFRKIGHLIKVDDPQTVSKQSKLITDTKPRLGPHPDDFTYTH